MATLTTSADGKMNALPPRRKLSNTTRAYIAVVFVLGASGYLALDHGRQSVFQAPHRTGFVADLAYIDLPRVTISTGGSEHGPRVRADIALEVAKTDLDAMQDFQPRIVDRINAYLSVVDPEELKDPVALAEIKRELLRQVNSVGAPAPVHDLMFRQLLVM